ncbi:hypothetical protein [Lactiplantibacillus plantarum]|uniref:hypothetical protein n=1 Tax=Lactiplantibacillus plantarum TaxID=1590 RepID=UPI00093254CB|nr:hypothetical protein [Lactiplantibacillus plantarum]MCS8621567.1 hypothetical protein [Lactiplantibacillus plantarum]
MFGKNRTAPVPAHGKHSLSLKPKKVSDPLKGFIPDDAGRVRISDEVLDSIVDQVEAHMLKRSKGKLNKVIKGPDKRLNNGESGTDKPIATKQPRVRIEFDDIAGTPKVFIDGVEQESVQHINLTWYKPDTEGDYAHGRCRIEMADKQRRLHGIGQGK